MFEQDNPRHHTLATLSYILVFKYATLLRRILLNSGDDIKRMESEKVDSDIY